MFDVVVIGHVSIDTNTSNFGTKIVVGGAAFLTAASASLYSEKVGLISRIGDDFEFNELQKWKNLNLSGIKLIKNKKSSRFSHHYLNEDHSIREWTPEFNVGTDVCYSDIPQEFLNTKYFHIATMPPKQQLPIIEYIKRNSLAIISVDTLENFVEDYFSEVCQVMEKSDLIFIDRNEKGLLKRLSNKNVMIKKGKEGACFKYEGKEYEIKTNPIKDVVDKTGAGDVFAGVFLANLAQKKDILLTMSIATKIATESIKDFGIEHLLKETI